MNSHCWRIDIVKIVFIYLYGIRRIVGLIEIYFAIYTKRRLQLIIAGVFFLAKAMISFHDFLFSSINLRSVNTWVHK